MLSSGKIIYFLCKMSPVEVRGNPLVPIQSRREASLNILIKQNIVVSSAVLTSPHFSQTFCGKRSFWMNSSGL